MGNDIVVNVGLNEILDRLVGNKPSGVLYCAVGTGHATPIGTEEGLGSEVQRVIVSTADVEDYGKVTLKAFFNTAQANETIGEHALFIKGAKGDPDDVMIDKGIEVPMQMKTATQEMLVEKVITLVRG